MASSVKPWVLAKVVNFSFISALGVWVRPGAGRRSLRPQLGEVSAAPTSAAWGPPWSPPSQARPSPWWGVRTVESGHVEVLAEALGARGVEKRVLVVVGHCHPHVVGAAPVWESAREAQLGTLSPELRPTSVWEGVLSPWARCGTEPGVTPSPSETGGQPQLPACTAPELCRAQGLQTRSPGGQQTHRTRT